MKTFEGATFEVSVKGKHDYDGKSEALATAKQLAKLLKTEVKSRKLKVKISKPEETVEFA